MNNLKPNKQASIIYLDKMGLQLLKMTFSMLFRSMKSSTLTLGTASVRVVSLLGPHTDK